MSYRYGWRPYVPVAQRRARAARELAALAKKSGSAASPVILAGRAIATTFWGKAWCDNLEAYSDFANRLPRGRSYVRNGSVVDLRIAPGKVTARVSGSSLYQIEIKIRPLAPALWRTIQADCSGKIDSLMELLQGKLSSSVLQIVTRRERGLFPTPKEIELDCSCPDWAELCKHVAAALYGVGARLDHNPDLLFLLRGVDPSDLISQATAAQAVRQTTGAGAAPALSDQELSDVFGIELAPAPAEGQKTKSAERERVPRLTTSTTVEAKPKARPPKARQPKPPQPSERSLSAAARARLAAAARVRWQAAKSPESGPSPVREPSILQRKAAAAARVAAKVKTAKTTKK